MLIKMSLLEKQHGFKPNGVLHIGASSGQEVAQYVAMGLNPIVMVEALPEVYEELLKTAARYPGANILCINACVSDTDGQIVTFHISDNKAQSSSFLKPKEHLRQHPTVQFPRTVELTTTTIKTLYENHDLSGIDFLNMDIQGAELHALKGAGDNVTEAVARMLMLKFPEKSRWES